MNDYDAGKCKLLAIGYEDTSSDKSFLDKLCERELVYTESVVAEIPMAFPLRQGISSGFSYWMYQGERSGVTLEASKSEFPVVANCDVHLDTDVTEGSETDQITVKNMFLPIIFFVVCAFIAVILQIVHQHKVKQGNKSLVGRRSTFNKSELVQSVAVKNDDIDWDALEPRNNVASLRCRPKKSAPKVDENFSFGNDGEEGEEKNGELSQSMSSRSLKHFSFGSDGGEEEEKKSELSQSTSSRSLIQGRLQEENNADSFRENSIALDFPGVALSDAKLNMTDAGGDGMIAHSKGKGYRLHGGVAGDAPESMET